MTDELEELKTRLEKAETAHQHGDAALEGPSGKQIGDGMQLAIDLVLSVGVSLFIGIFLDKYLHATPWFTLIFLIIGVAAGFRNFYIFARKLMRPDKQEPTK